MDPDKLQEIRKSEEYRDVPASFTVKAKKDDTYTITASTPDIDRDDEIILPTAFKNSLPKYLKQNPVILWMHDMWSPPVARAVDGRIGDIFELDITFATTPFAQEIKTLVDEGMLNTVSVGGRYVDWDFDTDGRKVVTDLELWETSIVTIPSNRSALIQRAKSAGLKIPNFEKLSDTQSSLKSKPEPQGGKTEKSEKKKRVSKITFPEGKTMDKIALINALIEKTEDAEELKRLKAELLDAIREDERKKLETEAAEKAKEAEEKKAVEEGREASKMAKIPEAKEPRIEVGTPGEYKGVKMKAVIDTLQHDGRVNRLIRAKSMADVQQAEMLAKWGINLLDHATKRPVTPSFAKALEEGETTEGGYLTPTEERSAVLSYIRDVSIAFSECSHVPMTSDAMTIPAENAKVSVNFTDEESDATETDPSFAQVSLTAKRLDAYTKVSNELIEDNNAPGGIAGILAAQFIEAIGQKHDSTVFLGTGSPMSGVFLSAGYSEVFDTGSTAFSELLESDIRNIVRKIRPNRRRNAKFYMSTSVLWQYVLGLKDGDSRPLFVETRGGGPAPGNLWGYPVREGNDDIMPSSSAAETGFIVFGDLAGVMIGERLKNVNLFVDPYSDAISYQTRFYLFTRWAYAHALSNYYARIVTGDADG
jgi:HK97 family phage major capsid protein/HK97 family phage prohead protease